MNNAAKDAVEIYPVPYNIIGYLRGCTSPNGVTTLTSFDTGKVLRYDSY